MNGGSLLGPDAFPVAEFLSVQVHEYGHYQNLAHTVVNGQIIAGPDSRGPSPFNTFAPPPNFADLIETMYPFLFINGGMATPHADDIAIFSTLYPEPSFATTRGSITGNIVAPNNTTPVTGVNVIARNIANPYDDAVSAISSDFTADFTSGSPFVGVYTVRGLTPGASYAIYVDEILVGGFSTPPRNPLPGPEEFYNGPTESNNPLTDPPGNAFTPVVAQAGITRPDIDIIFNRILPGPIPAGDDTSTELFPKFAFDFCGQRFESVFVNSNGNLTFGAGNRGLQRDHCEMLTGPPRIAALWDDLNAGAAPGSVTLLRNVPLDDRVVHQRAGVPQHRRPTRSRSRSSRAARRGPRRIGTTTATGGVATTTATADATATAASRSPTATSRRPTVSPAIAAADASRRASSRKPT